MTVKTEQIEQIGTPQHWTRFSHRAELEREEVFLKYRTKWRGSSAIVTMSCDRYRHSSGLSDWRVYASEARQDDGSEYSRGANLTDTARSRLSDACKPLALAWLASDEYPASESRAYAHAVRNAISEASTYSVPATRDERRLLALPQVAPYREILTELADAFDRYASLLEECEI